MQKNTSGPYWHQQITLRWYRLAAFAHPHLSELVCRKSGADRLNYIKRINHLQRAILTNQPFRLAPHRI
jgi:hypothetical protein